MKEKNRFGKLEISTQASEENLPLTKRSPKESKGVRSPRGGKPKKIKD